MPAPEPMVKILETVAILQPGGVLTVIHNRIPTLLYSRLSERGLLVETIEHPDGKVELLIKRLPPNQ